MTYATTTTSLTHREPALLGQTVIVIGGSAGIGLETARLARAEGASLILIGRNPERLQHAAGNSMRAAPRPSTRTIPLRWGDSSWAVQRGRPPRRTERRSSNE